MVEPLCLYPNLPLCYRTCSSVAFLLSHLSFFCRPWLKDSKFPASNSAMTASVSGFKIHKQCNFLNSNIRHESLSRPFFQSNFTSDISNMIQTFQFVNSNSSARPQDIQPLAGGANSVCGYYFKDKGTGVARNVGRFFN